MRFVDWIIELFGRYSRTVFLALLGIFAAFVLFLSYSFFHELKVFAVVQAMVFVVIVDSILIDKYILKDYDTLEKIFEKPESVGMALIALAILLHGCLSFL